jgi:hypothetical protein
VIKRGGEEEKQVGKRKEGRIKEIKQVAEGK